MGQIWSKYRKAERTNFKGSTYKYEGLCSAKDWKRDPKETQAIWDMLDENKIDRKLLEKAEQLVKRLLEKLEKGIKARKNTISMLEDLARELDKVHKDVNIAKVTGTSTAVAGGVIAVLGGIASIFTFGAASPLIGVGVATATAGGVTAGGAEIADVVISKNKMEEAQKIMDEDKKTLDDIDECYSDLDRIAGEIVSSNPKRGTKDQVLCSLLIGSKLKRGGKKNGLGFNLEFALCAGLLIGTGTILSTTSKQFGRLISRLMSRITRLLGEGVGKQASNAARTVLRGAAAVAAGVFLAFDIYELVKVSQDIHNGSKSEAAQALRQIAQKFQEQLREMEEFLEEIEEQSQNLWEIMKNDFIRLLQEIAGRKSATREEVNLVINYLQMCQPSEEWWKAFRQYVSSPTTYVTAMAIIFNSILEKVEEQQKREEKKKPFVEMDVTFIAHGNLVSPKLPCTLYHMNSNPLLPGVKSINLYEPWGCAIDSSVVYGIATGTIDINYVEYTDVVLPERPTMFNKLPQDNTLIPIVVFNPVSTNEGAYLALMDLAAEMNLKSRGLVIPYFSPPTDKAPLPEVPLWALANVLDVIGALADIRFNIHVAACLTTKDQSLLRPYPDPQITWPVVDCDQYCTVFVKLNGIPTVMWNRLAIPGLFRSFMANLDKLL